MQEQIKNFEKQYLKFEKVSPVLPPIKFDVLTEGEKKKLERKIEFSKTRLRRRDLSQHKKIALRIYQKLEF